MADARQAAASAALTADLLALGRNIDLWSSALALLGMAVLLGVNPPVGPLFGGLLVSLLAAALAKTQALRVALDEKVFRRWALHWTSPDAAPDADLAAFDKALAELGAHRPGRSLAERCSSARRLLRRQTLWTVLQTVSALFAALGTTVLP